VQFLLTVLLIAILAAAIASFFVMGLWQIRRRDALCREATEAGLRFSPSDLFDVPRRYGRFALITCGHSPRGHNVTYGRLSGVPVRAFDFFYELGHGTRRSARRYGVVVAETDLELPPVLMWNDADAELAPLAARPGEGRLGCWSCSGDRRLAEALQEACGGLASAGASVQTSGHVLMLCVPIRRGRGDRAAALRSAPGIVEAMERAICAGQLTAKR
jgi:hypothetical protein